MVAVDFNSIPCLDDLRNSLDTDYRRDSELARNDRAVRQHASPLHDKT